MKTASWNPGLPRLNAVRRDRRSIPVVGGLLARVLRDDEARVIDDAPRAADAELKAREYLRESPEAFVYVLNPDGNRFGVIL